MDVFTKLSRDAQIILGATLLYVIVSFFNWQQVSFTTVGETEWAGIGYVAALVAIVLLAWELARALSIKIPVGDLAPGLISATLALLLVLFTVITFLTEGTPRAWPAFVGLICCLVIGVVAYRRAKLDGVGLPSIPSSSSGGTPS